MFVLKLHQFSEGLYVRTVKYQQRAKLSEGNMKKTATLSAGVYQGRSPESRKERNLHMKHKAIICICLAGSSTAHLNIFQFHLHLFKYFSPSLWLIFMVATDKTSL